MSVDVLIPACDPTHLGAAVASALAQTLQPRVVVLDDGAGTCLAVAAAAGADVLHWTEKLGQGRAANLLLAATSAEWVVWLDHDDYYENPRALERLVATGEAAGAAFAWTGIRVLHDGVLYDDAQDFDPAEVGADISQAPQNGSWVWRRDRLPPEPWQPDHDDQATSWFWRRVLGASGVYLPGRSIVYRSAWSPRQVSAP